MTRECEFSDTILFESPLVRIGAFRCDGGHPAFSRSQPIVNHCVWFARTPVVIQPERARSFVANANTAVFYNRAETFARGRVGAAGDASDWFAVDESLAAEIVDRFAAPGHGRRTGPFVWHRAIVDSTVFLAQRRLFDAARCGDLHDAVGAEEAVVALIEGALAAADRRDHAAVPAITRRHRDLVHRAEVRLSDPLDRALSLADVARAAGASVYHLCRLFRRVTGTSMYRYRLRLRLRAALEPVLRGGDTLTAVACEFGFPSHSHFAAAFRREFGVVPSSLGRGLGRAGFV